MIVLAPWSPLSFHVYVRVSLCIASYRPGEGNRQEGQGSPDRENRLQVSDIFFYLSLKRRQGQPTPVLLPGKSHGQRSLVGCSPWDH